MGCCCNKPKEPKEQKPQDSCCTSKEKPEEKEKEKTRGDSCCKDDK
ncbi:MAG: hypothetical protein STSR0007_05020 [Thermovirga sp.]